MMTKQKKTETFLKILMTAVLLGLSFMSLQAQNGTVTYSAFRAEDKNSFLSEQKKQSQEIVSFEIQELGKESTSVDLSEQSINSAPLNDFRSSDILDSSNYSTRLGWFGRASVLNDFGSNYSLLSDNLLRSDEENRTYSEEFYIDSDYVARGQNRTYNGQNRTYNGNGHYIIEPEGGEDLAIFNSDELRFARWGLSLDSLIPGHGLELPTDPGAVWQWLWLPSGVLYRSYFASNRESRLGVHLIHESNRSKNYWDPTMGWKIPLLRYGTRSKLYPEGIQVDIEGAAIARLTLDDVRDLNGTDYRFGIPVSWRKDQLELMTGYYHISSHRGDEWLVNNYLATGKVTRINYVRDCIMFGIAWRPDANWRFYFGGDYAFHRDEGAEPWQLLLGAEYSPILLPGFRGSPFAAVHLKWNEETDWSTYAAFQIGWQWKTTYQHTFRTGLYIMSGYADQYQDFNYREQQVGYGLWYDL